MPTIAAMTDGAVSRFDVSAGVTLRQALLETGLHLQMPCAGNHSCGKCKVLCSGALSPLSTEERCFLTTQEQSSGYRLACFVQILGDVEITLPRDEVTTLSAILLPKHNLTERGWGLAVDIGTTTIAMQLYKLEDGTLQGEALRANQQARFGADVISRIEFSNQNGSHLLEDAIHSQLEDMAASCMQQAGAVQLDAAVITGNTTMLHFWEGLDPRSIAVSPFTPAALFGSAARNPLAGATPYLPPCLGSYVGGDITCAVLASGLMDHAEKTSLLVDLGTNGEIALWHNGILRCASTAMGPALEGAGLTFGMQAAPGAISAIDRNANGSLNVQVVSGCAATGLCGSGVLDAVRIMLEDGALDETGFLCAASPGVSTWNGQSAWCVPGTAVYVTQEDIRQIQLAKAALCAGIRTLLKTASLSPESVAHFYIAGGFGHCLNLDSAARVGLFPPALVPKAHVLGNAALSGAAALLLDQTFHGLLQSIQSCGQEIPLSGNSGFSEEYIDNITFESDE